MNLKKSIFLINYLISSCSQSNLSNPPNLVVLNLLNSYLK